MRTSDSTLQTPILVITFIGVSNVTYSSLQAVNSTYISRSSCDEQYLCLFCEHETNDPEDLHGLVVNEHACTLIELSDKCNNGEHGQHSLLSKITFDKCKNFFVCQVCGFRSRLHTNVNRHVAIEHTKIFPHVCDDCGKGFSSMLEYCKHLNHIYLKGFAYVNTLNIQQERLKILKFI